MIVEELVARLGFDVQGLAKLHTTVKPTLDQYSIQGASNAVDALLANLKQVGSEVSAIGARISAQSSAANMIKGSNGQTGAVPTTP